MDKRNRSLLQLHQHDIVKDLDVTFIIDKLYQDNAIANEDIEHISNLPNRADRTRYLIETLLQNGTNTSYQAFVDSLFKDYNWLWEKLQPDLNEPMVNASFEDSLSKGDVPRLPDHYVQRVALEQEVVSALLSLGRHKILALHGMPGAGKTSVAVGALRHHPDLLHTTFSGNVFWLNFGNCKTEDDILALQNKLYRKASSSMFVHNSYMNSSISMSSIGSNADSQSLSSYDWSWQELRDRLKAQFADTMLKDALLVLDEVSEKRYLEAFDIGCKILITTRDTDVVDNFQAQIIKINNNFDEKESLALFASCLDVDVSQLPRQAKKLHDICKGNPFYIALLGAILSENRQSLNHDNSRWTYYVNKLQKKDFLFLPRHDNPIKVCINALDSATLPLFKKLAILPDNAKVTAKVIGRLWDKEDTEVEHIMKQLRRKCLIIEDYNYDERIYIYEIHDLIMNCLRSSLSEDEMKKTHAEFLKRYHYENINTTPLDIVDDGYIAFYIGHHIYSTKNANNKWSLFHKLYLNLRFLGNKVKLTGPADVILDLQKYEELIVEDDLDKDLLLALKMFLGTHGIDLYRYPCTDLAQSILQHESKGILYSKAAAVAQENTAKNELYFEFLHQQNVEEIKHSTIDLKEESIRCVGFLGDYVLVGTLSGSVKMFNIATNTLAKELPGNGSPVKWVGACPVHAAVVAALAFDGQLAVWYVDDVGDPDSHTIVEEDSEELYNNNYPGSLRIEPKMGPFIGCRWMNEEETLIAHTSKTVILYDPQGVPKHTYTDLIEREKELLCCVPSYDDRYLIMATASNSKNFVDIVELKNKERVFSIEENDTVLDIITVPGTNRIIILTQKEVIEHELELNGHQTNFGICRTRSIITGEAVRAELSFLSLAVNKTGSLLFAATDDSRVICLDLNSLARIFDLENRRGNVVSMAVSEVWQDILPGPDVLLTGTGTVENCAKVWQLDPAFVAQNTQKNGKVRLTTKFDVSFVDASSPRTPPSSNGNSVHATPKRNNSFAIYSEEEKKKPPLKGTMSLDRHSKPCLALNLKGICNNDSGAQPLLAVLDDKNNIQIIRGTKMLTEIITKSDEKITALKISPCNQYIIYGLRSGRVQKYGLRTKETRVILDVKSAVLYLSFVNPSLLVAAGKNRCLMAYRLTSDGIWMPEMLQKGNSYLGSQEILNDMEGIKKKNGQPDRLSSSSSESSLNKDRQFPGTRCCLSESTLVDCFWVTKGLLTVEYNGTVKLWDSLYWRAEVLNGRQNDIQISCAVFRKNVLVICDDYSKKFQTFQLREGNQLELHKIQEYRLNNKIVACDLTSDGKILAMGLDSGDVVLWNVSGRRQLRLLKHHKAKVQYCAFSPLPERLFHTSPHSPHSPTNPTDDSQPPLVLVTMAAEIVWWNITYVINNKLPPKRINVVTPLMMSPRDITAAVGNMDISSSNFFFGSGGAECWRELWKKKTYKEGSKRKDILACIKLSGMNAKKLCFDEKFSCFVTVDNPGHIHIMNVMS